MSIQTNDPSLKKLAVLALAVLIPAFTLLILWSVPPVWMPASKNLLF